RRSRWIGSIRVSSAIGGTGAGPPAGGRVEPPLYGPASGPDPGRLQARRSMPAMAEPLVLRSPGPADARAVAELHYRSWIATYGPAIAPGQASALTLTERVDHWERLLSERPTDRGALVAER